MLKSQFYWIALSTLFFCFGCASVDKALPNKQTGPIADSLAYKIMKATHYEDWQNTGAIKWTFAGDHHHLWDRNRSYARVEWKKFVVIFDIGTRRGKAWKEGEEITGDELKELIDKAWQYWANDSFWLNPFEKLFDEGTERAYIQTDEGHEGLLITYHSGGPTPGDSYLWLVDSTGLPFKCKMWVDIIPFKGVPVSWDGWQTLDSKAKVAGMHKLGFIKLKLTDIQGTTNLNELEEIDPFDGL